MWSMKTRLGKVLHFGRPASLLVLLLLFLVLPNVAVSCSLSEDSVEGPGEFDAALTGIELVLGDEPSLAATGAFEFDYAGSLVANTIRQTAADPLVQKLTAFMVGMIVIGVAVSFLPLWRWRATLTAAAATVAGVLLVVANTMMVDEWQGTMAGYGDFLRDLPDAEGLDLRAEAAAAVYRGSGFWLTVIGLAVVAVVSLAPFVLGRRPVPEPPVPD